VGAQEGDVQLRDDGVLVVARVADEGRAVALGSLLRPSRGRSLKSSLPGGRPPIGLTIPICILAPSRGAGKP
jgi:hypothetical protein